MAFQEYLKVLFGLETDSSYLRTYFSGFSSEEVSDASSAGVSSLELLLLEFFCWSFFCPGASSLELLRFPGASSEPLGSSLELLHGSSTGASALLRLELLLWSLSLLRWSFFCWSFFLLELLNFFSWSFFCWFLHGASSAVSSAGAFFLLELLLLVFLQLELLLLEFLLRQILLRPLELP
ncbi:MAG: hypothetical protein Ct9H300mP20_14010 [Gammaproteobacteria bacterium]|nr:MAG: hypothetical protein Ct9H300mP20_14010 [Gammaproteobacteria bacterium]